MAAKLVLDMAAMQDEFFADTALIGIVCALPSSRFCWTLNHKLDIGFERQPDMDIILQIKPGKEFSFPVYKYDMPHSGNNYILYKLKNDKESLLPEVAQLDYLWMVQSKTADEEVQTLSRYLREIPEIQLAQIVTMDRLKNTANLIL